METVIINQNFEKVALATLLDKLCGRKICVFGDSNNNKWLYDYGLGEFIVNVFDNNKSKWGCFANNVLIEKPHFIKNRIAITVLSDLAHIIPQIRRVGYDEFYFICSMEVYRKYAEPEIGFLKSCGVNFVWDDREIKYAHVIPDQKFILPLIYILEKGLKIQEHAFLIYDFNRGNYRDEYNLWKEYVRLQKKYKNIAIVDGFFSFDKDIDRRWEIINKKLCNCDKIIFHGEWFSKSMFEFFFKNIDLVKEKSILLPWSGQFGYVEHNRNIIKQILRFCHTICVDEKSEYTKRLIIDISLKAKRYYYNGLNYVQPIDRPKKKPNKVPKVFVSHSCYMRDRVPEALSILSRFSGKIEVYSIGSYGEDDVINNTEVIGEKLFGEKFHIIKDFMDYERYVEFLNDMDIAVMATEVGSGNTTLQILFYTGTKLFLKRETNTYNNAKAQGYYVYDYYTIPRIRFKEFVSNDMGEYNFKKSEKHFLFKDKVKQWKELFELDMN